MLLVRCATVDITPRSPVRLAGFVNQRLALSDRIADGLEINAICFEAASVRCTLLSFDTLSVGSYIEEKARRLFGPNTICIASHTHFAPALDRDLPTLGEVDDSYFELVAQRLTELKHAMDRQKPRAASFRTGHCRIPLTVNRRRRALSLDGKLTMRMLPNPSGIKDDTATVVQLVDRSTDEPIAFLWSFACHPVSFHDADAASSDYCGVVRKQLRERHGADMPCVFAQGFCGDVRPPSYNLGKKTLRNLARWIVKRALQGRFFGDFTEQEWSSWADAIAESVVSTQLRDIDVPASIRVAHEQLALGELHESPAIDYGERSGLDCTCVLLGGAVELWALSGEPVTEIAGLLPSSDAVRIKIGYAGHVFGYIPTSAMIAEGGYEVHGFRHAFSLPGRFAPNLSDILAGLFGRVGQAVRGGPAD